jgi:hypothetical protein
VLLYSLGSDPRETSALNPLFMSAPVRVEIIPCPCSQGALKILIVVKHAGVVDYSEETVTPCPACGSRDIEAARLRLVRAVQREASERSRT